MNWKLATFNVNGVRARLGVLADWLAANRPDALCLQEIKAQDADFPAAELARLGYQAAFWGQKSYNGVAILTLNQPAEVTRGFGGAGPEDEARLISLKVDGVWLVNAYVPQGREVGHPAFAAKLAFLERLAGWLAERFSPETRLVLAGDLNVAPGDLDVFDPQRLAGQVGCHPDERAALGRVMAWGLVDLFRQKNPDARQFTFWDYRLPQSFKRNLGWRIDHLLASPPLAAACAACRVDMAPRGLAKPSDHTPLLAEFDL
jgi:exodeoxyribonuclease-3